MWALHDQHVGTSFIRHCTASACRQNVRGLIGGNAMVPEIADAAATSEVNAKLTPHHSDIFSKFQTFLEAGVNQRCVHAGY
jgi:hypothetical protein